VLHGHGARRHRRRRGQPGGEGLPGDLPDARRTGRDPPDPSRDVAEDARRDAGGEVMPTTVQERDQKRAIKEGSWDWWTPEPLPSVPAMWPKAPWNIPVLTAAVDQGRTRELHAHEHSRAWVNCKTGMGDGRFSGVPWQNVRGVLKLTKVWERRK